MRKNLSHFVWNLGRIRKRMRSRKESKKKKKKEFDVLF